MAIDVRSGVRVLTSGYGSDVRVAIEEVLSWRVNPESGVARRRTTNEKMMSAAVGEWAVAVPAPIPPTKITNRVLGMDQAEDSNFAGASPIRSRSVRDLLCADRSTDGARTRSLVAGVLLEVSARRLVDSELAQLANTAKRGPLDTATWARRLVGGGVDGPQLLMLEEFRRRYADHVAQLLIEATDPGSNQRDVRFALECLVGLNIDRRGDDRSRQDWLAGALRMAMDDPARVVKTVVQLIDEGVARFAPDFAELAASDPLPSHGAVAISELSPSRSDRARAYGVKSPKVILPPGLPTSRARSRAGSNEAATAVDLVGKVICGFDASLKRTPNMFAYVNRAFGPKVEVLFYAQAVVDDLGASASEPAAKKRQILPFETAFMTRQIMDASTLRSVVPVGRLFDLVDILENRFPKTKSKLVLEICRHLAEPANYERMRATAVKAGAKFVPPAGAMPLLSAPERDEHASRPSVRGMDRGTLLFGRSQHLVEHPAAFAYVNGVEGDQLQLVFFHLQRPSSRQGAHRANDSWVVCDGVRVVPRRALDKLFPADHQASVIDVLDGKNPPGLSPAASKIVAYIEGRQADHELKTAASERDIQLAIAPEGVRSATVDDVATRGARSSRSKSSGARTSHGPGLL